jgi:hypothetical protein
VLVVTASLLAACALFSPHPDPSRFFVLTPLTDDGAVATPHGPSLGIGPVTFPRYLDRSEMVARVGPNEVRPASFDYWAGSLPRQFEAALSQNLQRLTAADSVHLYPWYPGSKPDLVVEVDVRGFERDSDGLAHLSARWRIRRGTGGEIVRSGDSTLARPAGDPDPGSTAAALSGVLGDFSREVAQAVRGVGL